MQVSTEVRAVLSAAVMEGAALKLTGQLDRKLYTETNKVLEAAGGKWNRKAGAHIFDGDASEAIEPILLTGEYRRTKQDFGQFDTPEALAARVAEEAGIESGMMVLEPSAGIGRLVQAALDRGAHSVVAYEVDEKRARGMESAFYDTRCVAVRWADFLKLDITGLYSDDRYDRVIMNPPFAKQADIAHVLHAWQFLKPGGRLVAIMSAGVTFRQDKKAADFRAFVDAHGGTIELLDPGAFKESGTMVQTCLVVVDKP